MSDAGLLAEVQRILREVQELRGLVERRLPTVLSKRRAAQELSISVSKLKALIRSGDIMVCEVGRTTMVPASEVLRLASVKTSRATPASRQTRPRMTGSPSEEARAVREALKKPRRS